MNLLLDKSVVEKGRSLADPDQSQLHNKEVYKTLQDSVNSGRVGNLKLDRGYLVFEPQSCKKHTVYFINFFLQFSKSFSNIEFSS